MKIVSAEVVANGRDRSQSQLGLRLSDAARREFVDFTTANVGRKIVFLVDGEVASEPIRILTPMTGGVVPLPAGAPKEVDALARRVATGSVEIAVELAP